jgi:prevent-host-death family protein
MATDLSALDDEEIGITDARRNLAELVTRVRLLGQVKFLTSRDRRVAVVVSVEWFERAEAALARESADS